MPYFFPDTFHEGGDPVKEAKINWVTARRAILRKSYSADRIRRISEAGDPEFPDFVQYIESPCAMNSVRLYENIQGTTPYCVKRVAVLNCWGKMRSWGNHMVHHAIYYKQNYSYFGIIEALSGAPFDVSFISFDDIRENQRTAGDSLMSSSMWEMRIRHRAAVKTGLMRRSLRQSEKFVYQWRRIYRSRRTGCTSVAGQIFPA